MFRHKSTFWDICILRGWFYWSPSFDFIQKSWAVTWWLLLQRFFFLPLMQFVKPCHTETALFTYWSKKPVTLNVIYLVFRPNDSGRGGDSNRRISFTWATRLVFCIYHIPTLGFEGNGILSKPVVTVWYSFGVKFWEDGVGPTWSCSLSHAGRLSGVQWLRARIPAPYFLY